MFADFDKYWNYRQPAETEMKFLAMLPDAVMSNNADYHLQLLTQIARAQGLQHKFAQAHHTLDEVAKSLPPEPITAHVRYQLERGRVYNTSGNKGQALPCFTKALELATQLKQDDFAADALHMLAIISPPDDALQWNLKALHLAQNSDNEQARAWLGSLYNNLGWTYFDQQNYALALQMFQESEQWFENRQRSTEANIARWSVAKTLRYLQRPQEALVMQTSLLKQQIDHNREEDGYIFEELAECLLALNRHRQAQKYFSAAYHLLRQDTWLVKNEPGRLQRLKELATAAPETDN